MSSSATEEDRRVGTYQCVPQHLFSSPIFTFVVGPKAKEFNVHTGVFELLSPYFHTLFNRGFKESREKRVEWDAVGVEDFERLCQFAYNGDYLEPGDENRKLPKSAIDDEDASSDVDVPDDERISLFDMNEGGFFSGNAAGQKMVNDFLDYDYCKPLCDEFIPSESNLEDIMPLLLFHAQMYVLADAYCIDTLQKLALHKIHRHLCAAGSGSAIKHTVELMKFILPQTQSEDKMRKVLTHYLACFQWYYPGDTVLLPVKALCKESHEFSIGMHEMTLTLSPYN
ncbi:hypothetical protein F4780DRAFT_786673 [Xylariomycetidae sp. FL0641]|nr:hypothetical protein F4780DRAFT_786673 [Xylariomycetidae sp. FL0641]